MVVCDPATHPCLCGLSSDARTALLASIHKFKTGTLEHGPLDVTRGDWLTELLKEHIDASHYAIFEIMKILKEREAKTSEAVHHGTS